MTNEQLRNKLTPVKNLITLIESQSFPADSPINLVKHEIAQCKINLEEICKEPESELLLESDREKEVQTVCRAVLMMEVKSTGDYASGAECPFCGTECYWAANDVSEIKHAQNCVVLIAKDLTTNLK